MVNVNLYPGYNPNARLYYPGINAPILTNDGYVVSLLHMNGADQSTDFPDSAANGTHTWTHHGGSKIVIAQSVFGGACAYLDGVEASGTCIDTPDSTDWYFGAADFTIEFFVRFAALPASAAFSMPMSQYVDDTHNWYFGLYNNAGTYSWWFALWNGTRTISLNQGASTVAINNWYHVAMVRYGNIWRIFHQGNQVGTDYSNATAMADLAAVLQIGRFRPTTGYYFNGWIDEPRISKGIARYKTASFTVPIVPFISRGDTPNIIVLNDLAHAEPVDEPALTQVHNLAVDDLVHADLLDSLALSQVHNLLVDALSHAHAIDGVALTQVHNLLVDALSHTHSLDGLLTLIQNIQLAVNSLSHAHGIDNVILVSEAIFLIVDDLAHGHSIDSLTLTQVHNLIIQAMSHLQSMGSVTLSQIHHLILDSLTHLHGVDNVTLLQHYLLIVEALLHAHKLGEVELIRNVPITEDFKFKFLKPEVLPSAPEGSFVYDRQSVKIPDSGPEGSFRYKKVS